MAFFYICALLFIVFSPERRGILKTPYPYIAFLLSIAVFSPVIIWNAQHDWVTLRHTSGQAHISEGFRISLVSFFEFIASQIGVLTPILSVMIIIALLKQKAINTDDADIENRRKFLFWFSMPVIVFFALKSLQGKVQANWAMTGYITGVIAFSKVFLDEWGRQKKSIKAFIIAALSISFLLASLAHYPAKLSLPLNLDPSARLRGWEELGREVSSTYSFLLPEGSLFLFSDRYQVSSELAFYVKGNPVVYCANTGSRMNQYDLWPGFNNLIHYNAIFVTIGDTYLPARIREAFKSFEKQVFRVYEKDRVLREYSIFICHDFKGMREERIERY
ncbi:MAG: glycosyltransferase family 39 protein, partial [Nitrospirota bacterium]